VENLWAVVIPLRTPLGELTAFPQTPYLVGMGLLSPPQEHRTRSRLFGLAPNMKNSGRAPAAWGADNRCHHIPSPPTHRLCILPCSDTLRCSCLFSVTACQSGPPEKKEHGRSEAWIGLFLEHLLHLISLTYLHVYRMFNFSHEISEFLIVSHDLDSFHLALRSSSIGSPVLRKLHDNANLMTVCRDGSVTELPLTQRGGAGVTQRPKRAALLRYFFFSAILHSMQRGGGLSYLTAADGFCSFVISFKQISFT